MPFVISISDYSVSSFLTGILDDRDNSQASRLTAAALAGFASPPMSQLSAWHKKPETHEQVAIGVKTGRSTRKTQELLYQVVESPRLTATALTGLVDPAKSQLNAWSEEPNTHEELAVGVKTSRSEETLKALIQEVQATMKDNGE
ncbi:hypothetical protein N7G274_005601 [Stereocaulon virgatum]|uniref:Uncharacterized protein n=1 Tax=Stereocaulon virgatum TaxID=373712 RepID=A0ABR4A7C7_9LECA